MPGSGTPTAPLISAISAAGWEDTVIPLSLSVTSIEGQSVETLTVALFGLPNGAVLSAGAPQADGSWLLAVTDLPGLTVTPPPDFAGALNLVLRGSVQDAAGHTAVSESRFSVDVAPVVDGATLAGQAAGSEDTWIPLEVTFGVSLDASESWDPEVVLYGVPEDAALSQGEARSDGSWLVDRTALETGQVAIRPPPNSNVAITLRLEAVLHDADGGGASQTVASTLEVQVAGVADAPVVHAADVSGHEDTAIPLALTAALSDRDGSERLALQILGVPLGAKLSHGVPAANGSWTVDPVDLPHLALTPPPDFSGTMHLTLVTTSHEYGGGTAVARHDFAVDVTGVADVPLLRTTAAIGDEDTAIPLRITALAGDLDGSEHILGLRIEDVPVGAVVQAGGLAVAREADGSVLLRPDQLTGLRIIPPWQSDQDFVLRVSTVAAEPNGSRTESAPFDLPVTVRAVADAPVIPPNLTVPVIGTDKTSAGSTVLTFDDVQGVTLVNQEARLSGTYGGFTWAQTGIHAPSGNTGYTTSSGTILAFFGEARNFEVPGYLEPAGSPIVIERADKADFSFSGAQFSSAFTEGLMVTAKAYDDGALVGTMTFEVPKGGTDYVDFGSVHPGQRFSSIDKLEFHAADYFGMDDFTYSAVEVPSAQDVHGQEDGTIPLQLSALQPDADGSEILSFVLSGLPNGASLSVGSYRGPGTWSLTAEEAARAVLRPPPDFAGSIALTLTAVTQEKNGGSEVSTSRTFTVRVGAVVDAPRVGGLDGVSGDWGRASNTEDQPILLNLDPGLADRDGSEHLVGNIAISGVPAGAVLRLADNSIVTPGAEGLYRIDVARMAGVTLTMPPHSDLAATLTIHMTVEDTGGIRRQIGGSLVVDPAGDADDPVLTLLDSSGAGHNSVDPSHGWIPLHVTAALADTDGSETLQAWVRDVPQGAVLSAGTPAGGGLWLVPASDLATLAVRPPAGYGGTFTLRITGVAVEREGDQAVRTGSVTVAVAAPGSGSGGASGSGSGSDIDSIASNSTAPAPTCGTAGVTQTASASTLKGTDYNDTLYGRVSRDQLIGDDGDDTLYGYGSNTGVRDQLVGDGGNDTFVFGSSAELASTVVNAGSDDDTVRLLGTFQTVDDSMFVAPAASGGGVVRLVTSAERLELLGTGTVSVSIGTNFEHSFGDAAIEALQSSSFKLNAAGYNKDLTVLSGAGNDTIITGDDEDRIDGGAGNDIIVAGAEDDTIMGSAGSDKIDGGADDDRLVYRGKRADYVVTALTSDPEGYQFSVASKSGAVDKIKNVEYLDFADASGKTPTSLATTPAPLAPAAQARSLSVTNAVTAEDASVHLVIGITGANSDGGRETVGVRIDGLPTGALLSAGVRDPVTGVWALRPDELAGLKLTPPAGFGGSINLTVRAISVEATGDSATTTAALSVEVTPVADAVTITAAPSGGTEDLAVPLNLNIALRDPDGSESITAVMLSGLPAGARITGTGVTDLGGGRWSVDPAHLGGVQFVPPANASGDFHVTVAATVREAGNGHTRTTSKDVQVHVTALADPPIATAANAMGSEDHSIPLNLSAHPRDLDGSEVLSAVLQGLPKGTRLSAGTNNGDGSWTLTEADLPGLTMTPPADWSGDMALTLLAHARESSNGSVTTSQISFHVGVTGVADAPLLGVADLSGSEDNRLPLDLQAQLVDDDGSERITAITIGGLPDGFSLSKGTLLDGGRWQVAAEDLTGLDLIPKPNWSGTVTLTAEITNMELGSTSTAGNSASFRITITAVDDAPTLVLAASEPVAAGSAAALSTGGVSAADVDSAYLTGATVTLTGALLGDSLGISGFVITDRDGHQMIGDTGIEIIGGGFDAATGTLRLGGNASPGVYGAVLSSLVLESSDAAGLSAGTRTVGVAIIDDTGATSTVHSVALDVGGTTAVEVAGQSFTSTTASEALTGGEGADHFLLTLNGGHDTINGGGGAWTDQIDIVGAGVPDGVGWTLILDTPGATVLQQEQAFAFDRPVSGHIAFSDGTQTDFLHIERVTWS
ncbi:calcium-binding protein [Belnapia moabensis]|uniref:calcium-binding protein n=1 Tax=Belnapia moabensis TaxID=365533 RepID=UPI0014702D6F|nr:hypothetical protein [Belnapia moabensis]